MLRDNSLAHHERLRSRGSIRRLFESGKSGFVYPLRYMWFAKVAAEQSEDSAPSGEPASAASATEVEAEVLFTVPKRFHKRANKRNLLRRRVKESYRLQKSILLDCNKQSGISLDIAMVYSTKEIHTSKTISNAVRKILENIANEL